MSWELELAKQITSFWANNPGMGFITYFLAMITTIFEYGLGSIILGITLLFFAKTRKTGMMMLIALLVFALIGNNLICKHAVMRLRPVWEDSSNLIKNNLETIFLPVEQRWLNLDFWAIPKPTSYSFMSGHTVAAFIGATIVFLNHKKTGIVALAIAALVGFSRIYFGVHYVSDVVTGMLYGTAGALITYFLYNKFAPKIINFFKNKFKKKEN